MARSHRRPRWKKHFQLTHTHTWRLRPPSLIENSISLNIRVTVEACICAPHTLIHALTHYATATALGEYIAHAGFIRKPNTSKCKHSTTPATTCNASMHINAIFHCVLCHPIQSRRPLLAPSVRSPRSKVAFHRASLNWAILKMITLK